MRGEPGQVSALQQLDQCREEGSSSTAEWKRNTKDVYRDQDLCREKILHITFVLLVFFFFPGQWSKRANGLGWVGSCGQANNVALWRHLRALLGDAGSDGVLCSYRLDRLCLPLGLLFLPRVYFTWARLHWVLVTMVVVRGGRVQEPLWLWDKLTRLLSRILSGHILCSALPACCSSDTLFHLLNRRAFLIL